MKKLLLLTLLLTGCAGASNIEQLIGVEETDNAVLLVCFSVGGTFTSSNTTGSRIEFPEGFDTSSLTLEDINEILEACPS